MEEMVEKQQSIEFQKNSLFLFHSIAYAGLQYLYEEQSAYSNGVNGRGQT